MKGMTMTYDAPYVNGGAEFTARLHQVIALAPNTESGKNDIGLYNYPIHNEAYRPILNQKIIEHYYNQEIEHESIALFRLAMRRKMNEIMPRYVEMYKSLINYDILRTVDYTTSTTGSERATGTTDSTGRDTSTASGTETTGSTGSDSSTVMGTETSGTTGSDSSKTVGTDTETRTGSEEGSATSNGTNAAQSRVVNSDTPQVRLSGDADYASSLADSTSQSTSDSTSSNTSETTGKTDSSNESTTTGTNKSDTETASSTTSSGTTKADSESATSSTASGTTAANTETVSESDMEQVVHIFGYQSSPAESIAAFRNNIINIDLMIIEELRELFLGIWNNGSTRFAQPFGFGWYGQWGYNYPGGY